MPKYVIKEYYRKYGMKVDICKLYYEFWNKNTIAKHNEPKDILVTWSGLELQQFVEFALQQVNGVESKEKQALHKQNVTNCPLCGCETLYTDSDKCTTPDCPNCIFF